MESFYDDLCSHLTKAKELYSTFKSDCKDASKCAGKAALKCKREGDRLNSNKKVSTAVGGGLAVAGVGIGVVLSKVAGIFSFGIGTVVGLATTAAVTTTAGIAAGVETTIYAVDCHLAEKSSLISVKLSKCYLIGLIL